MEKQVQDTEFTGSKTREEMVKACAEGTKARLRMQKECQDQAESNAMEHVRGTATSSHGA